MIAKSIHNLAGGGMDFDSALEYVAQNDCLEAYNTRVDGTGEQEGGYVTNIESNALIAGNLPIGINTTIGGEAFPEVAKAYSFVFNSNNYHLIQEYNSATNIITNIFTNIADSGGVSVLKLEPKPQG